MWVNPFYYYVSGIVENEVTEKRLRCEPSEVALSKYQTRLKHVLKISQRNFTSIKPDVLSNSERSSNSSLRRQ